MWLRPTVIIKAVITLAFSHGKKPSPSGKNSLISRRNIIACILAAVISPSMYFTAECILYNVPAAVLSIPANILQSVISGIVYTIIVISANKAGAHT
jgi:hypothetical protein